MIDGAVPWGARYEDPSRPNEVVVDSSADDDGVAIGGEGHGVALVRGAGGEVGVARANQLFTLLRPEVSAPRPDPRGTSAESGGCGFVVAGTTDDGRVAISREGDGNALPGGSLSA